jgi:threonine/homoserine/homoserine lactone efflux protein
LISESLILWSFWGIGIMFLLHIWMDYAWLSSTALLSSRVSKILSNKNFKFVILALSCVLVYFGMVFLIDAFG